MTENEALESALKKIIAQEKSNWGYIENFDVDENWAVRTAIEHVKQYRQIGTVEECRAAMEKQRRKIVKDMYGTSYIWKSGYCPVCGCGVTARWDYCQCCGQKLNWQV